jgi:thioredoxin 1
MKVLKFEADWCAPCKALSKLLESVTTDVVIEKVNIDTDMDRAKQYGVRGIPVMIILNDDGSEIKRGQNFKTVEQIEEFLKV